MVTKVMQCKQCGREVVRIFPTEERAKHCTYAHCDVCKRENYEKALRNGREKNRKKVYVGNLKNDEINEACDRFFLRKNIKLEQQDTMPYMKEDTTKAVAYGEAAAKRCMKGVKDGN